MTKYAVMWVHKTGHKPISSDAIFGTRKEAEYFKTEVLRINPHLHKEMKAKKLKMQIKQFRGY